MCKGFLMQSPHFQYTRDSPDLVTDTSNGSSKPPKPGKIISVLTMLEIKQLITHTEGGFYELNK